MRMTTRTVEIAEEPFAFRERVGVLVVLVMHMLLERVRPRLQRAQLQQVHRACRRRINSERARLALAPATHESTAYQPQRYSIPTAGKLSPAHHTSLLQSFLQLRRGNAGNAVVI